MPSGSRLSEYEAGKIDAYIEAGKTQAFIAGKLNRSQKAIHTYLKKKATYFEKHKNGSKKMLTKRDERSIARHISATGSSLSRTKHALNLQASKATIWRTVSTMNTLRYVKAKRKPKLLEHHKVDRVEFARVHMTWNFEWTSNGGQ